MLKVKIASIFKPLNRQESHNRWSMKNKEIGELFNKLY